MNILPRKLFLASVGLAFSIIPVFADQTTIEGTRRADVAQIRATLNRATTNGRTMSRAGSSFHRRGTAVFTRSVVGRFRGVVTQGTFIKIDGNNSKNLSILPIDDDRKFRDVIEVVTDGITSEYPIDYDDLLPLALFADSGATSAYSLTTDINDEDAKSNISEWAKEAGMVITDDKSSVIAIELHNTPFERALKYVDLCQFCEGDELPALARKINSKNNAKSSRVNSDESWLITDVLIPYEAQIVRDNIKIEGTITRNRWTIGEGEEFAYINSVTKIERKASNSILGKISSYSEACQSSSKENECHENLEGLLETAVRDSMLLELEPLLLIDISTGGFDYSSLSQKSDEEVGKAYLAFETIALFRHAKLSDPEAWSKFMNSLSSDFHIGENMEAWKNYTSSLSMAGR